MGKMDIRNTYERRILVAMKNLQFALNDALEHRNYTNRKQRKINTEILFGVISKAVEEYPDGNVFDEILSGLLSILKKHPFKAR